MEGGIKVTTERLKEKSGEWAGLVKQTERMLLDAKGEMERLEGCFAAEALTMLQKVFCQQAETGIKQIGLIREQIGNLLPIAAGYEEAEAANENSIPKN